MDKEWNEGIPTKKSIMRDIDIYIKDFKQAIRERLEEEHNFYEDETGEDNVGTHKPGSARVLADEEANKPPPNADAPGSIFKATDTGQLYYDTGTEWLILTPFEIQVDGEDEEGVINFKTE